MAQAAKAADAPPAATPDDQLQTITVTAQRTRQKLQEVPASVTAFSADAMDRLQIQTAMDVSRLVPNVKIDAVTGGSTGLKPYIRGGGVSDGGQITSESEVGVYVDDVYRARLSASLVEFVELDRIEVLRGPQGVLYGRNSSGGAVNLITRGPSDEFGGNVELGYGSWNDRRIKGFVTGPISSDHKWRASVQGMFRDRDGGRQHNVTLNKDVGGGRFDGVQGDLAFVDANVEGRLTVFSMRTNDDGQWAVPNTVTGSSIKPSTGDYRTVASPVESYTRVKQDGATFKVSANLSGAKVTSITGYSHLSDAWRQDFSGGVSLGGPRVALFDRISDTGQHQFSEEVQVSGKAMQDKLEYVGGLFYFSEKGQQDVFSSIFFTPSRVIFRPDTSSTAVFGQLTWHMDDKLALLLGGRQTTDEKKLDGTLNSTAFSQSNTYRRFTPKVGLDYKVDPEVLTYISYSEGFKSGGYNGLASSIAQITQAFLPQYTKAYEAGIKADLLNRTLRLNTALFYNDIKNRQQTLTVASGPAAGTFVVENYNAELRGLELELAWRAMKGLSFWGNASFNHGRYKSCSTAAAVTCSIINNKLPVFPNHTFTLGFDYDTKLGAGKVKFGADYSMRGDYFSTADNVLIGAVPKQKFLNAYTGYDMGDWSFQLAGKNLLQQEGWQTGFGFAVVQPRFAIEPRTVQISVKYRF